MRCALGISNPLYPSLTLSASRRPALVSPIAIKVRDFLHVGRKRWGRIVWVQVATQQAEIP